MKFTKKEFRQLQQWIAVLYEEKYPQTTGSLQTLSGYCCLGVACELFIPHANRTLASGLLIGGTITYPNQPGAPDWLQKINIDFVNITDIALTELNDKGFQSLPPYTFPEIAMLLELVYIYKILEP